MAGLFTRSFGLILLILFVSAGEAEAQRDWRVHSRGMLHQSVFNTGELGRPYSAGGTVTEGRPSMEWPPNSRMILDRRNYAGQHLSFGSGVWIAGTTASEGRKYALSGAVSNTDGESVPVLGVFSSPIRIERIENYPVLEDGSLNPAFNPNEAEEIIISVWDTPVGIRASSS